MSEWNGIYYNETLAKVFHEETIVVGRTGIAVPIQPIVIEEGELKGIIFPVLTREPDRLYAWHWNWETKILSLYQTNLPSLWTPQNAATFIGEPIDAELGFVSSDYSRKFIAFAAGGSAQIRTIILEITELFANNTASIKSISVSSYTYFLMSPVGYADRGTFAVAATGSRLTDSVVKIFSVDNEFPSFTVARTAFIPFQQGNAQKRPLILYGPYYNNEYLPRIVSPDGQLRGTLVESQPPVITATAFCVGHSSLHMGYDFFVTVTPHFLPDWKLDQATQCVILDWVKDESNYIFIKNTQIPPVEVPTGWTLSTGKWRIKHIAPAGYATTISARAVTASTSYSGTTYTSQEAVIFQDGEGNNALCLLTPLNSSFLGVTSQLIGNPTFLSPPTYAAERGAFYLTAVYGPTTEGIAKVGFLRIINPQFYSRFFSSIPVVEQIEEDDKWVSFVGRISPPRKSQFWSLVIVSLNDPEQKVTVADLKKRVTPWEQWEISSDGITWTVLAEGTPVMGHNWLRLKIPKSVLEWKKDEFAERFPNRKWRMVFISEPSIE